MDYYLVCRSLTYAQRAERVLKLNGILCRIVRSPREISTAGCSFSLRLSHNSLPGALVLLRRNGFDRISVYMEVGTGLYQEVLP